MEKGLKMNAREAALYLGFRGATSYFYALVRKGIVPSHKRPSAGKAGPGNRGGGLYFYASELDKWLASGGRGR